MPHDPDAVWKPGYTGAVRYPDAPRGAGRGSGEERPPPNRSAPIALIAGIVGPVVVIALVLAVAVLRTGDDGVDETAAGLPGPTTLVAGPPTSALPAPDLLRWAESSLPSAIPTSVTRRWSFEVLGSDADAVITVASASSLVAVLPGNHLHVVETADGTSRWSAELQSDPLVGIDIVGGVVLARHVRADGSGRAIAYDLGTGQVRWRRDLATGEQVVVPEGAVLLSRARPIGGRPAGVELLEPHTGVAVGEVVGDDVRIGIGSVQRYDGAVVEWFDLTALQFLGIRVHQVDGGSTLDHLGPAGIVLEQLTDGLIVTHEGALAAPWSAAGRALERVSMPRNELLLVEYPGDRLEVMTARTGQRIATGDAPDGLSRPPLVRHLASNGAVLTQRTRGPEGEGRSVVGVDPQGHQVWDVPLDPGAVGRLVDGALMVIEPAAGSTPGRLTYYD